MLGAGDRGMGPACAQSSVQVARLPSALGAAPRLHLGPPGRPGRAPRLPDARSAVAGLLTAGAKHFPKIAARGEGQPWNLTLMVTLAASPGPGPAQPHLTVPVRQGLLAGAGWVFPLFPTLFLFPFVLSLQLQV